MAEDVLRGRIKSFFEILNISHSTDMIQITHSFIPSSYMTHNNSGFGYFFVLIKTTNIVLFRSLCLQNKYKQPIFDRNCTNTQTNIALNSDFAYVYSIFLRLYSFSLILLFSNFLYVNLFLPFYGIKRFCSVFHLAISQF